MSVPDYPEIAYRLVPRYPGGAYFTAVSIYAETMIKGRKLTSIALIRDEFARDVLLELVKDDLDARLAEAVDAQ